VLGELKVIAKGSAKHKEILIQSLKMYDRIVCVTGDDAENALAIQ
jgi:magnesium-transporting ATPase (P-type)